MIKNIMTFVAVISLLTTISCKNKEDNSDIVLDENNMIVSQDVSNQMVLASKKTVNNTVYPRIEIETTDFDFGNISQGDIVSHVFKFRNSGKTDLVILDAHASCGCTVPEWTKTPIQPGNSGQVKISFNSEGKMGKQEKTVTLSTNTEEQSEVIHFKAYINPKAGQNPAKTK
jgi:hypothetical protein